MSSTQQAIRGVTGFGILVLYSWIMIATGGEAASWVWLLLAAGAALLIATARSAMREARDDS